MIFHSSLNLIPGRTYILWGCGFRSINRTVQRLLKSGYRCHLFTKHHPRFFPEKRKGLEIVWVSTGSAPGSIPPNREKMFRKFEDIITGEPAGAVIILDVFNYLASPEKDDFSSTLVMLRLMVDRTAVTNDVLLVPISSKSFGERQRAQVMSIGVQIL